LFQPHLRTATCYDLALVTRSALGPLPCRDGLQHFPASMGLTVGCTRPGKRYSPDHWLISDTSDFSFTGFELQTPIRTCDRFIIRSWLPSWLLSVPAL